MNSLAHYWLYPLSSMWGNERKLTCATQVILMLNKGALSHRYLLLLLRHLDERGAVVTGLSTRTVIITPTTYTIMSTPSPFISTVVSLRELLVRNSIPFHLLSEKWGVTSSGTIPNPTWVELEIVTSNNVNSKHVKYVSRVKWGIGKWRRASSLFDNSNSVYF